MKTESKSYVRIKDAGFGPIQKLAVMIQGLIHGLTHTGGVLRPGVIEPGETFPLSTPILRFSKQGDMLTLDLATRGIVCLAQTGGGKSSTIGTFLPEAAFRAGHSAMVLVTKATTIETICQAARVAGRFNDLIFLRPGQGVFNWIEYEAQAHGGSESAVIPNIIEAITTAYECVRRTSGSGAGEQQFWSDSRDILLSRAAFIDTQANGVPDLQRMLKIVQTLATSLAALDDPEASFCLKTLEEAKKKTPESRRLELQLAEQYFQDEVPRWSDKTRSSVQLCATTLLTAFLQHPLLDMISGKPSTVTPDDVVDGGKILVMALPFKEYYGPSKMLGCLVKLAVQKKLDRRLAHWKGDKDLMRPCWLICDDGHAFATRSDVSFQSTAREARAVSCFLTQGISSLKNEFATEGNGQDLVSEFLMNHACKFFGCNDDPESNEYASKLIGDHLVKRPGGGTSQGPNRGGNRQPLNQNMNWSMVPERWFKPEKFRTLRMGGKDNRFVVDVVAVLPGVASFKANHKPYLKIQFHQKGPCLDGPSDPIEMWRDKKPTARIWVKPVPWWKVWPFYEWADFWGPNW